MSLFLIALGAFVATFLGGLFALKFNDKLHLVLGFSAGAVIGVAFFDLLPESIEIAKNFFEPSTVTLFVAIGFGIYVVLDRAFHTHDIEHSSVHKGKIGAGSFSVHSFLDGLAIGFAFHVSPAVGLVVALAVLAHDFSDGINTVSMILRHGGSKMQAFKWLLVDASAPVLGIIVSQFVSLPEKMLGIALALFCGFFLYIGASDLLPESHHNHPTRWTTVMTVLGMVTIYLAIKLAHF